MRLLLDTSALVHLASGTLSATAADALRQGGMAVISPVIPWELAIKVKAGKLDLPLIHRDPFDRILVATALREQFAVLTPDRMIAMYPVVTVW